MEAHTVDSPAVPTEIWREIFHILLWDDIIFDSDPVSSSHQPHIALRSWYDTNRLLKLWKQRATLRTVSKRWKDIADTSLYQYLRPSNLTGTPVNGVTLQRAYRLQFGHPSSVCSCRDQCICRDYAYWCFGGSREPRSTRLLADSMSSIGRLRAKILVLPGSEWNALMAKPAEAVTELLGEVRSLVIETFVSTPKEISIICPNLTFLALHLTYFSWEKSAIEPVTFPDLSTLQIVVDREEDLQKIGRWKMPSLKYLELRMSSGSEDIFFADFLQGVGKGLISLQIGDTGESIVLFDGFWSALPKVRYFGVSTLYDDVDMWPLPPQDHPLRTISNREPPDYNFWRRQIIDVVDIWTRIECISDTHLWEDMEQEILKLERSENQLSKHYCKSDNFMCHQCIYDGNTRCEERNVRYEDAFGRTWAEYKQGKWSFHSYPLSHITYRVQAL
ncbi:hypothetical protein FRC18_005947 [Serendipita sp. 400]|nr:hypothetical protein FRC18_005947 [Serendipita sp. 400]